MRMRALRSGMTDFILMTAPKVPTGVGAGMKSGQVALTPWRRDVT